MELNLFLITLLPLAIFFSIVLEDIIPSKRKLFKIISIALLIANALLGVIMEVNIYIGIGK